jgi:hypothetical protein
MEYPNDHEFRPPHIYEVSDDQTYNKKMQYPIARNNKSPIYKSPILHSTSSTKSKRDKKSKKSVRSTSSTKSRNKNRNRSRSRSRATK